MSILSVYIFDGGDWKNSGLFTNLNSPNQGDASIGKWNGIDNMLSIVRSDNEYVQDLFPLVNTPNIKDQITNQFLAVSKSLPAFFNVYFVPPIKVSYVYGEGALGPGKEKGGLSYIPDNVKDQPILTINVNLHMNTPGGMASVDGAIVYYVYPHFENMKLKADFLGVAHPWHFNNDGYQAYQDEINLGLEDAGNHSIEEFNSYFDSQIQQVPAQFKEVYLLPGGGQKQQGQPIRGDARYDMSLALLEKMELVTNPNQF